MTINRMPHVGPLFTCASSGVAVARIACGQHANCDPSGWRVRVIQ